MASISVETRDPVATSIGANAAAAQAAAPASFEEYVTARGPGLVRFATLLTGDPHRAEDLVQDALGKVYLRWSGIRRSDDPDVYVRRVIVNGSRSWWRRRSNHELPVEQTGEVRTAGDVGAAVAERDAMRRWVAQLPHRQRTVLVLRYYDDLDDAAIAQILGCSQATVRTHAMRGLNALRTRHIHSDESTTTRSDR